MGLRERVEMVLSFVQFLALLLTIPDIPFPTLDWEWLLTIITYIDIFAYIPYADDFKVQFVIVVVGIPQLVNFLILIGLNRKRVVVWYFSTLGFICAFVAGIVLRVLGAFRRNQDEEQITNANTYMIVGAVGVIVCFLAAVFDQTCTDRKVQRRIAAHEEGAQGLQTDQSQAMQQFELEHEEVLTKEEQMMKDSQGGHILTSLLRFISFALCLILGLFFIGVLNPDLRNRALKGTGVQNLAGTFGIVFLVISAFVFGWFLLGLWPKGRLLQLKFGELCEVNLMRICLIFLSLIYIPVVARIVMTFNCNTFTCAEGTRHTPAYSAVVPNSTATRLGEGCEVCEPSLQCGEDRIASFCPETTRTVLEYARHIDCEEMQPYFFPAAALMLAAFAIGLPVAFMKLTSVSANILAARFPVLLIGEDTKNITSGIIWALKVNQSTNITKFLYQSFQYKWKQARLLLLIHKLILVATTLFIVRMEGTLKASSYVPILSALVVHTAVSAVVWYAKPFIHPVEDRVYRFMYISLALTAIGGFLGIFGIYVIPTWLAIVLLVLNVVLPLGALVVTLYYTSRDVKADTSIQGASTANRTVAGTMQGGQGVPPPSQNGGTAVTPRQEDDRVLTAFASDQVAVSRTRTPAILTAASCSSSEQKNDDEMMLVVSVGSVDERVVGEANAEHDREQEQETREESLPGTVDAAEHVPNRTSLDGGVENETDEDAEWGTIHEDAGSNAVTTDLADTFLFVDGFPVVQHTALDPQQTSGGPTAPPDGNPFVPHRSFVGGEEKPTGSATAGKKEAPPHNVVSARPVALYPGASAVCRFNQHEQPVPLITKEEAAALKKMSNEKRKKELTRRYERAQAEIDRQINEASLYIVRKYFMICGALGFIALALCILGISDSGLTSVKVEPDNRNTTTSTAPAPTISTELLGYQNWTAFTEQCCCQPYYNDLVEETDRLAIEKWSCLNGWIKERVRSLRLSKPDQTCAATSALSREQAALHSPECSVNGLSVRGMCGATFTAGCSVSVKEGTDLLVLEGCPSTVLGGELALW